MLKFKRKNHTHSPYSWDGYYERCKCGAFAGDMKDENGMRYILFSQWPKEQND